MAGEKNTPPKGGPDPASNPVFLKVGLVIVVIIQLAILYFVYSASSPVTGLTLAEEKSCQEIIKIVGTAGGSGTGQGCAVASEGGRTLIVVNNATTTVTPGQQTQPGTTTASGECYTVCPRAPPACNNETPCRKTGERCGPYGSVTAYSPNQTYGNCCEGLTCNNGICGPRSCQEVQQPCGYVTTPSASITAYVPGNITYYGDCCTGLVCNNNLCSNQSTCPRENDLCGHVNGSSITAYVPPHDYGDCCNGFACVNNHCRNETSCRQAD
ncbi:Uncharacterised protein [uncultured archaeon]|nr:Uncharacterised protein [uncultured archaeon]